MEQHKPLSRYTPAALRARAAEYRQLAKTTCMAGIALGLLKVADRYEALAEKYEAEHGAQNRGFGPASALHKS